MELLTKIYFFVSKNADQKHFLLTKDYLLSKYLLLLRKKQVFADQNHFCWPKTTFADQKSKPKPRIWNAARACGTLTHDTTTATTTKPWIAPLPYKPLFKDDASETIKNVRNMCTLLCSFAPTAEQSKPLLTKNGIGQHPPPYNPSLKSWAWATIKKQRNPCILLCSFAPMAEQSHFCWPKAVFA